MSRQIPEIRFKDFTDEWEQRKLGELSEISRGASPRPIQDPKWFDKDSDIGWLRIADVTEQDGRITHLEQKISKLAEEKTRVLLTPHLLLSIAATVGKPLINYVKTGVHDGFLIFYNPQFDQEFMFQWLEMFRPKWKKYGQPGSQVNLNSELVKNQNILLPDMDEQTKISTFFKSLDDIIALHQDAIQRQQRLKKAMLQKLFPINGGTIPTVRFSPFTEEWEQRKLGDYANYRRGSFPQPYGNKEWYDGEGAMPFVQVVDVSDNLRLVDNTKQMISKLAQPKSIFVPAGKVIVTLQGSIGRVAITQYDSYLDRTILIFEDYKKLTDEYFWAYTIQRKFEIEKEKAPGGTIKTITKEALSSFEIYTTKLEEQQKIGAFFQSLDNTITLHQQALEKFKLLKKSLLQKMFI